MNCLVRANHSSRWQILNQMKEVRNEGNSLKEGKNHNQAPHKESALSRSVECLRGQ